MPFFFKTLPFLAVLSFQRCLSLRCYRLVDQNSYRELHLRVTKALTDGFDEVDHSPRSKHGLPSNMMALITSGCLVGMLISGGDRTGGDGGLEERCDAVL